MPDFSNYEYMFHVSGVEGYIADLRGRDFSKANLRGRDFSETNLSGAIFREADLRDASFHGAILTGADFSHANLVGVDLFRTHMEAINLSGANLTGVDLGGRNLSGANLNGANLSRANVSGANLCGANLTGVNLSEVNLSGMDFSGRDLSNALLLKADLRGTDLRGTVLDSATITDAWLWETRRAGWSIRGIICEAVYLDKEKKERTVFRQGEFERFYADKTKIVLHYDGGISPIEILTLPALIQRLEAEKRCILRLYSIQEEAGGAMVTLIVDAGEGNPAEIAAMKAELEEKGRRLISAERKALEAEEQQRQAEYALRYLSHEVFPRLVGSGSVQTKYFMSIVGGEQTMGDKYIAGQVGALGPSAHAHDMTFNQLWSQSGQSINLGALATELATLRQHLRQEAVEPEHDVALGAVANAEVAAKEGNGPKALEWLGTQNRHLVS
jgi:uncharacterized protein YjbI with pentapeptide repeats